ncbi:MAG TPA: ATP-binding protein, partial [Kiloniellales bacterium]|nr:ATP-binding protein [Kiloniellales bacterium]
LDSMRLDSGEVLARPTECDLAAELNEARARQLEANPRRRIQIEIGEEVPARFTSDPLLLQQILANLLANAISYSPESELVILRARAASGRLRISVIDHGIGIPEQEQEMLFQPYFRASTTRQVRGIGIGLHLSQSLASILGGSLSCESTQGIGSTFTLDLPL